MNKKFNEIVFKNENYTKEGVETILKKVKDARHIVCLNVTYNSDNAISTSVFNFASEVSKMYNDKLIRVSRMPLCDPALEFEHLEAKDNMSGIFFGNQETVKLFNEITTSLGIDPNKSITHIFIDFTYDKEKCVSAKLSSKIDRGDKYVPGLQTTELFEL